MINIDKKKVKVSTLYSWVNNGLIPVYRLNGLLRFDIGKIKEWIERTNTLSDIKVVKQRKTSRSQELDFIIKNAIEEITPKKYNLSCGKPNPGQGLGKEE